MKKAIFHFYQEETEQSKSSHPRVCKLKAAVIRGKDASGKLVDYIRKCRLLMINNDFRIHQTVLLIFVKYDQLI